MTVQKFTVPDGLYRTIDKRMGEIKKRLNQDEGSPLDPAWVAEELQRVLEGKRAAVAVASRGAPTPAAAQGRFPELILAPEQLITNCRAWNEMYSWGFSPGDFQVLPDPPKVPDEPFCALVLTPCPPDAKELPGLQRGFDDLWTITAAQQPNARRWDGLRSDPDHLQLLEGATYAPGLSWEVLDLGAHWDAKDGIAPHAVRDPKISPHLGVLAATAHCPRYVPTMDGATRPFLWIPGLRATVPGCGPWQRVPCVWWNADSREVKLHAHWDCDRYPRYAVPVRREG